MYVISIEMSLAWYLAKREGTSVVKSKYKIGPRTEPAGHLALTQGVLALPSQPSECSQ